MEFPLQPLRVPAGWLLNSNSFLEVDPSPASDENADMWFKEDLLQAVHERRGRLLDLGWYPDGDITDGEFRIVVYDGDFRGRLVHTFVSRHRLAIVAEIERLFDEVAEGRM